MNLHNPDIKKFVLMRKIDKQREFYWVIGTRASDPRAVGKHEKDLGHSTWELGSLPRGGKLRPEG